MDFSCGSTTEADVAKAPNSGILISVVGERTLVAYQILTGRERCLTAGNFEGDGWLRRIGTDLIRNQ